MLIKKITELRIGNTFILPDLDLQKRNNRSPFAGYLFGSWGKVYFIKTSPYLKQIFNWAILGPTPLVEKLKDFYIN
jgi:hypothetical protein